MTDLFSLIGILSSVCCVLCAAKSVDTETLSGLIVDENASTVIEKGSQKCEEVPQIILAELLGEAYNSRYMSVNRPMTDDDLENSNANDRNAYTVVKRKVDTLPSFYVEEKHSIELSEKPAWDIRDNLEEFESQLGKNRRKKRAISIMTDRTKTDNATQKRSAELTATENETVRNKRAYSRKAYDGQHPSDIKRLYPWLCDSTIKWIDLGPDYFPRFLRTVECEAHYCYFKMFMCRPKSFAVKVLHRKRGVCADASNLRKNSSFVFRGDFGELWKWEEVAVNFCCECAIDHPVRKFA